MKFQKKINKNIFRTPTFKILMWVQGSCLVSLANDAFLPPIYKKNILFLLCYVCGIQKSNSKICQVYKDSLHQNWIEFVDSIGMAEYN